jgi:hypothetical protein
VRTLAILCFYGVKPPVLEIPVDLYGLGHVVTFLQILSAAGKELAI